jgi:hypothetical protein
MEGTRLLVDISLCDRGIFRVPKAIYLVADMSDRPDDNYNHLDGFGESFDRTKATCFHAHHRLRRYGDADHPIDEISFLKMDSNFKRGPTLI